MKKLTTVLLGRLSTDTTTVSRPGNYTMNMMMAVGNCTESTDTNMTSATNSRWSALYAMSTIQYQPTIC